MRNFGGIFGGCGVPLQFLLQHKMVRTRANNAAVRKAVVAKAPRKNIAAGRSAGLSPAGGSGPGKKKGKTGSGCHSLKLWPVPKGQKGLQNFFNSSSNDIAGPSSDGAGPSSAADSEDWERIEGEPGSSGQEEQLEDGASESQETGSSVQETNSSVHLLDEDIAQLNSDDSDED